MWGVIPAAGLGSRIQPLAFSKELLPVGTSVVGPNEQPRAVSEYIVERLMLGGATKLCFVISAEKCDIVRYYAQKEISDRIVYVVQRKPAGLCDALFRSADLIPPNEQLLIGLPDTIWFPADALRHLPDGQLSLLLFPVGQPQFFDAVVTDEASQVRRIEVKQTNASSRWVWGALKMPGSIFRELRDLWVKREYADEFLGTLINAWIALGGRALGLKGGQSYHDVGTPAGFREVVHLLGAGATPRLSPNLDASSIAAREPLR